MLALTNLLSCQHAVSHSGAIPVAEPSSSPPGPLSAARHLSGSTSAVQFFPVPMVGQQSRVTQSGIAHSLLQSTPLTCPQGTAICSCKHLLNIVGEYSKVLPSHLSHLVSDTSEYQAVLMWAGLPAGTQPGSPSQHSRKYSQQEHGQTCRCRYPF